MYRYALYIQGGLRRRVRYIRGNNWYESTKFRIVLEKKKLANCEINHVENSSVFSMCDAFNYLKGNSCVREKKLKAAEREREYNYAKTLWRDKLYVTLICISPHEQGLCYSHVFFYKRSIIYMDISFMFLISCKVKSVMEASRWNFSLL